MKSPRIPSRRLLFMKLKRTSLYTWSPTTFDMDITIQNQFAFQPIYYIPIITYLQQDLNEHEKQKKLSNIPHIPTLLSSG